MLEIHVSNNIRIRGASTPLRSEVTRALTIPNPEYVKRKAKRIACWGIPPTLALWIPSGTDIIAPRGFLSELEAILVTQGLANTVIHCHYNEVGWVDFGPWNEKYTPWPHQIPAIAAMVAGNGIIQAPAGAGKTLIGMKAIQERQVPTLWLAHTIDLIKQAAADARKYMPGVGRVGMLAEGVTDWGDGKLIVATAQTLNANPKLVETLNSVIGKVLVDEAHHFPSDMFNSVVAQFTVKHLNGVTATPDRKDRLEKVMFLGIGPKLHEVPRDVLYETGFLIKPTIEFIYTNFSQEDGDRNEVNAVDAGGDGFDYLGLMRALCADKERAELIGGEITKEAVGNCQLILSDSIRYLYRLRDEARKQWKATGAKYALCDTVIHGSLQRYTWYAAANEKAAKQLVADGKALDFRHNKGLRRWETKQEQYTAAEMEAWQISPKERAERIESLRNKKVQVVYATAQLVQEGLDIPHLTIGHLATPKRGDSREKGREDGSAVEQAIGRIQRRDPDNPNKVAIWKDYVDYGVGVLKDQYESRRKVYARLGLAVPRKKAAAKSATSQLDNWLGTMPY